MKTSLAVFFALTASLALGAEPDGLILQPNFHASVVAEGLGPIRHLTVRDYGDIYVSTPVDKPNSGSGIVALHLDSRIPRAGQY